MFRRGARGDRDGGEPGGGNGRARVERMHRFPLWFGVLAGPTSFTVAFMTNVFLTQGECQPGIVAARYGLVAAGGLAAIAALLVARRNWGVVRGEVEPGAGGTAGRNRFLAVAGIGWSSISILLALALATALVFLDPCIRELGDPRLWSF